MSLISRFFKTKRQAASAGYAPPQADRVDMHHKFDVVAFADVIAGYRFCATMQLRTPLRVLRRHGEVHNGIDTVPPKIGREMWEGIWTILPRTFRDLGWDVDEPLPGTMASDVGPIPSDGGDYLRFLIAVREKAEAEGAPEDRRRAVAEVLEDPSWAQFIKVLGGKETILDRLFPPFISTVPRLSAATREALMIAGFDTPESIQQAGDDDLLAFKGVGPAIVQSLRASADSEPDRRSRFVDRVIR
jgi:hypothetical protein